jgi:hypothetical protein
VEKGVSNANGVHRHDAADGAGYGAAHASACIDLLEFCTHVMTNLYALGDTFMSGSIPAKAQGWACAEDASGVGLFRCSEERDLKDRIWIFSRLCMAHRWRSRSSLLASWPPPLHGTIAMPAPTRNCSRDGTAWGRPSRQSRMRTRSTTAHWAALSFFHTVAGNGKRYTRPRRAWRECNESVGRGVCRAVKSLIYLSRHFGSPKSVHTDILPSKICSTPSGLE